MEIAESMRNTAENIIGSYNVRVKGLGGLVVDTQKTLKGFASDRKKMAREQAETLEKGETDRLKSFKVMMGGIQKDIKDIETYVINKLKEFSDAHADMREEQAETLKKGETDRLKSFKVMMEGIRKDIKDIETYVKKLLGEYSSDMKKAANAWQGMSKTMARARKGMAVRPKVEAKVKIRPVKEAVK